MSAQPCGCDPECGGGYMCRQHLEEAMKDTVPAMGMPVATVLPEDGKERKKYPIVSGVIDYFPDAIAYVAHVSYVGNEQHNPGQPLHWAREKSTDHADCMGRHLAQRGTIDTDKIRHSGKLAWRALANLQLELEAAAKTVVVVTPWATHPLDKICKTCGASWGKHLGSKCPNLQEKEWS